MIITETVTINGHQFLKTYSNDDRYVVRDGVAYDEAIDPLDSGRVYTEGEKKESDATAEELLDILLGEEEEE